MISEYTKHLKAALSPIRDQLVNQIVAGGDDAKTDNTRGQIKGIDRCLAAIDEAARTFVSDDDSADITDRPASPHGRSARRAA